MRGLFAVALRVLLAWLLTWPAVAQTPNKNILRMAGGTFPAYQCNYLAGALCGGEILSTSGNRTMVDATGKLTYAPNNLVLQSNTLTNGSWLVPGITRTGGQTDQNGGTTAVSLVEDTSNGLHRIYQQPIPVLYVANTSYIVSAVAKNLSTNGARYANLAVYSGGSDGYVFGAGFDLLNGVTNGVGKTTGATTPTSGMTSLGNGWYLVWMRFTTGNSPGSNSNCEFLLNRANVSIAAAPEPSYVGDGISGAYVSGLTVSVVTYETTPRAGDQVSTTTSAYFGPRFPYDPSTLLPTGLLSEGSATNLNFPSVGFASTTGGGFTSRTNNYSTSPDGTTSSTRYVWSSTANAYDQYNLITNSAGVAYTASMYIKANVATGSFDLQLGKSDSSQYAQAHFDATNNNVTASKSGVDVSGNTASVQPAGNGWYRITVTATFANAYTGSFGIILGPHGGGNVGDVVTWGLQLETGPFPTSYIPTASGAATRAAESYAISGVPATILSSAQGTVVAEVSIPFTSTSASNRVIGGTGNGDVLVGRNSGSNAVETNLSTGATSTSLGSGTWSLARTGAAWDAASTVIVGNGGSVATVTGNYTKFGTYYLGVSGGGSAANINGLIRSAAFYASKFPNSQLQSKATLGVPY